MRDKIIDALRSGPLEDEVLEYAVARCIGGGAFHGAVEGLRKDGTLVNDAGVWSLAPDALALIDLERLVVGAGRLTPQRHTRDTARPERRALPRATGV